MRESLCGKFEAGKQEASAENHVRIRKRRINV